MEALTIGSSGLAVPNRKPKDYDIIATPAFIESVWKDRKAKYVDDNHVALFAEDQPIVDIEIAWPGSLSAELLDIASTRVKVDRMGHGRADLNILYALKMSHRFKKDSPHFYKTMLDIKYLRALGGEIDGDISDWYARRVKETLDYSHPALNKSKGEFFTDSVEYIWDHDDIHKAIARGPRPAYINYQKPGSEVECSRALFNQVSQQIRLDGVYEEAMVLSLERSIWPYAMIDQPEKWQSVFMYALMKVCTSITSGWFREFAWEHHDEVAAMWNPDDVMKFYAAIKANRIGRHK